MWNQTMSKTGDLLAQPDIWLPRVFGYFYLSIHETAEFDGIREAPYTLVSPYT